MTRLSLPLFALLLSAAAATAQAPVQIPPSPKALALAKRYVDAAQAGRILEDEGPAIAGFMISRMPAPAGGEAKASEVKHAMLDAANAAVAAKMPDFLDKTAVIYAGIYTEKELEDIVAFYDSPAGKAFVSKGQAAAEPMADLIHSLGGEIQADTEQRFCAKEPDSCKAADAPPATAPKGK